MDKSTMSVQELSAQMGISLPKAYELVKRKGFPTLRIGTRILIPVDGFREWLKTESGNAHILTREFLALRQNIAQASTR